MSTTQPTETACADHPTRPVTETCARCGRFLCDWCLKTAPSWAPGSCAACQRVLRPPLRKVHLSFGIIAVNALLVLVAFSAFIELRNLWLFTSWATAETVDRVALVVQGLVTLLCFTTAALFAIQRRPGLLLARLTTAGMLGVHLLRTWMDFEVVSPIPAVFWGVVYVAALVYLVASKAVKEAFRGSPGQPERRAEGP